MSVGAPPDAQSLTAQGKHFSCSMSAVLIARVREYGGAAAVAELLRAAGSDRSVQYLTEKRAHHDGRLAQRRPPAAV